MSDRLPSGVLVSALLRRVSDAGGLAVVRARGDAQAGAILLVLEDARRIVERGVGLTGKTELIASGPSANSGESLDDYWQRRRQRDPDLWVVALDIPDSERFAAETILLN